MRLRSSLAGTLLFAAVSCGRPMLWIGELAADAGPLTPDANGSPAADATSAAAPSDASLERDASRTTDITATLGDRDAGAPASTTTDPPRTVDPDTEPTRADAAAPSSADDADGGGPEPDPPPTPAQLPAADGPCPVLSGPGTYTFGSARRNLSARVFIAPDARTKPAPGGPLILYWHALAASANQVLEGLGQAAIDDVVSKGGVVASFSSKYCSDCGGLLADDGVWYKEDDVASDHLIARALAQARIDPRRIHAIGFSAGAMRTIHLANARSNFIASVVAYSGGDSSMGTATRQDPANAIPAIAVFGGPRDTIGLDWATAAHDWYDSRQALGWYTMACDHGGGHTIPEGFGRFAYRFFLDHPYKVSPEPYAAGVPSEFPDYCSNGFPE